MLMRSFRLNDVNDVPIRATVYSKCNQNIALSPSLQLVKDSIKKILLKKVFGDI